MDDFRFKDGTIVSAERFHEINLAKLKDEDLNTLSQKCFSLTQARLPICQHMGTPKRLSGEGQTTSWIRNDVVR